jgi:hypothetical protein
LEKKTASSTNGTGTPISHPEQKISSKWIRDLNVGVTKSNRRAENFFGGFELRDLSLQSRYCTA